MYKLETEATANILKNWDEEVKEYYEQYQAKEYVKAALVCISEHKNPIYVPIDYIS